MSKQIDPIWLYKAVVRLASSDEKFSMKYLSSGCHQKDGRVFEIYSLDFG